MVAATPRTGCMASGHCHTPPCSVRGSKIWGKRCFRLIGPFGLRRSMLRACPPLFGIWTGCCGKSASMTGCRRNLPASTVFAPPGSDSRRASDPGWSICPSRSQPGFFPGYREGLSRTGQVGGKTKLRSGMAHQKGNAGQGQGLLRRGRFRMYGRGAGSARRTEQRRFRQPYSFGITRFERECIEFV